MYMANNPNLTLLTRPCLRWDKLFERDISGHQYGFVQLQVHYTSTQYSLWLVYAPRDFVLGQLFESKARVKGLWIGQGCQIHIFLPHTFQDFADEQRSNALAPKKQTLLVSNKECE